MELGAIVDNSPISHIPIPNNVDNSVLFIFFF